MTRYCFLAVAALVANCGCVCATSKPALLNPLPRAVVTLNLQPISLIYETPVLVSLFALQNTEIVLGNHLTVKVTNAPTSVNTVVTKTCYGCTTESRFVTGVDVDCAASNTQAGSPTSNTNTANPPVMTTSGFGPYTNTTTLTTNTKTASRPVASTNTHLNTKSLTNTTTLCQE